MDKKDIFIEDFKTNNLNNDLVKLCVDQGWRYTNGDFYYSGIIYVDTVVVSVHHFDHRIVEKLHLERVLYREICVPLPEHQIKDFCSHDIYVPATRYISDVTLDGNHPHISSSYDDDDDSDIQRICLGTLEGAPIYDLWKMVDMLRVTEPFGMWIYSIIKEVNNLIDGKIESTTATPTALYIRDKLQDLGRDGHTEIFRV